MLTKPMRLASYARAAIKPKQDDSVSAPEIRQIDSLIAAIAALMNLVM